MTPIQLAREIELAYDGRDRETLIRYTARLAAMATAQSLTAPATPGAPTDAGRATPAPHAGNHQPG